MKKSKDRLPENFSLSECNLHHHAETLSSLADRILLPGKAEKPDKPVNSIKEYSQCQYEYKSKNYLIQHDIKVI